MEQQIVAPISFNARSALRSALKAAQLWVWLIALFCMALPSVAQQVQQDGRVIEGTVVSTTTGKPLSNASVSVTGTDDRTSLTETITGADGRFVFGHLRDGKYSLRASHRGFIPAAFDEHATGSTAIVTGPGLISTGLQFKLQPQAAIYGTITEDSGDPVPQATVVLYRVTGEGSAATPARSQQNNTIDDGSYEISSLAPGKYYVAVTGKPWYATQTPSVFSVNRTGEPSGRPHSALDVAYPTTFYPDATDQAYASPIELGGGERVQVNLTLHPVPSVHLTMQFRTSGPNSPPIPQLRQDIFGSPDSIGATLNITTPDAQKGSDAITTVELSGFAPGQYDLAFVGTNGEAGQDIQVNLTSDQALDAASAVAFAPISGKITRLVAGSDIAMKPAAGGDANPELSYQIHLIPQQGQNQYSSPIAKGGSFHLPGVPPGTYELSVTENGNSLALTQITASGATIEGNEIKIGSDPVTILAKVTDATVDLHGFAKLDGKPVGGVFLELIPMGTTGPITHSSALQTNQSDSDGSFDFPKVLPGAYVVLAIQEGWTLDFTNPEAMQAYVARGLKVTVPLNGSQRGHDVVLGDAVNVQPAQAR